MREDAQWNWSSTLEWQAESYRREQGNSKTVSKNGQRSDVLSSKIKNLVGGKRFRQVPDRSLPSVHERALLPRKKRVRDGATEEKYCSGSIRFDLNTFPLEPQS